MFTKFTKKFGFALGCLFAIIVLAAIFAFSWLVICVLVYLVTLCFDWTFNWAMATGIWLLMILARSIVNHKTGD